MLSGLEGFAQGLTGKLVEATGQKATIAEVVVQAPDLDLGETTEQLRVQNLRTGVPVAIEPSGSGDREQVEGGVKVTGSHRGVVLKDQSIEKNETYVLVTAGSFTGEYFRVVGAPDRPIGHHWELDLELLTQENPVVDRNLLAEAFTDEFTEEFA